MWLWVGLGLGGVFLLAAVVAVVVIVGRRGGESNESKSGRFGGPDRRSGSDQHPARAGSRGADDRGRTGTPEQRDVRPQVQKEFVIETTAEGKYSFKEDNVVQFENDGRSENLAGVCTCPRPKLRVFLWTGKSEIFTGKVLAAFGRPDTVFPPRRQGRRDPRRRGSGRHPGRDRA